MEFTLGPDEFRQIHNARDNFLIPYIYSPMMIITWRYLFVAPFKRELSLPSILWRNFRDGTKLVLRCRT